MPGCSDGSAMKNITENNRSKSTSSWALKAGLARDLPLSLNRTTCLERGQNCVPKWNPDVDWTHRFLLVPPHLLSWISRARIFACWAETSSTGDGESKMGVGFRPYNSSHTVGSAIYGPPTLPFLFHFPPSQSRDGGGWSWGMCGGFGDGKNGWRESGIVCMDCEAMGDAGNWGKAKRWNGSRVANWRSHCPRLVEDVSTTIVIDLASVPSISNRFRFARCTWSSFILFKDTWYTKPRCFFKS